MPKLCLLAFGALAVLAFAGATRDPSPSRAVHAWTTTEEAAYIQAHFAEAPRR